jgi:putative Mn2+ efflux pump MntP
MDALAVSVTNGSVFPEFKLRDAFRIAFFFGLFQALMPVAGWMAGLAFHSYIQDFDHWIALGLLLFVGGKMIWESRIDARQTAQANNCLHWPTLLMLSVATSIDALAIGISFAMWKLVIWMPIVIIGIITFVNCFIGIQVGSWVGSRLGNRLGFIGGIILILIGVKIVIEHSIKAI